MKTREVIQLLKISYLKLAGALRNGKIRLPAKDISGDFDWTPADVEAARRALAVDRRVGPRKRKAVASR